jgi:glycosyltransferase involved in cell wall biosynthesis
MIGVPMIVSDIPPLLEVVGAETPDGACADIFRTGDADDLTAKILHLLNDQARLRELGGKARSQTPIRFSIAAHLNNLRDLYENLLRGQ